MTNRDKFIRWYVRPFNRLKRIPDGDGAFAALSIGFFLCERYYRIKTNTITQHRKTERFLKAAAKDFDCNYQVFRTFWYLFRNGIQHQGAPKKSFVDYSNPLKPTIRMRWALSDWISHRPGYLVMDNTKRVGVCPWKFTRFILCKFLKNERALERSTSHSFGSI
jgi:hypothetical protein